MDIREALQELARMVKNEIILRLHSSVGINPRTGTNTLIGSELERSIDVMVVDDSSIEFQIADYYEYVVRGWKRTGRYPGTAHLFISNILDWIRRKNIRIGNLSQNQIAWILYRKMLIEGRDIAPRPFINYDDGDDVSKILPFLDDFFSKWADSVFEMIMEEIDKFFNN